MRVVVLMLAAALAGCSKKADEVPAERGAANADFQDWVGSLPDKLKAPEPNRKSRIRGLFQGCLMATTADHVVTCRCNVRAFTKTYQEPELGLELDRAWVELVRPWKLASPDDIAKVQARVGTTPADPVKAKAVQTLQTVCGEPESLKQK